MQREFPAALALGFRRLPSCVDYVFRNAGKIALIGDDQLEGINAVSVASIASRPAGI